MSLRISISISFILLLLHKCLGNSFIVDEDVCQKSRMVERTSVPVLNSTSIYYLPYVVATNMEGILSTVKLQKEVAAETDLSFLFLRPKSASSLSKACSLPVRQWGANLLKKELSKPPPSWAESVARLRNQRQLYAHMNIIGRHDAITSMTNETYYRILKSESMFIFEISSTSSPPHTDKNSNADASSFEAEFEAFIFYWRPPREGRYRLTLDIDFANCKEPLAVLNSNAVAETHNNFCYVIFAPYALQMEIAVKPSSSGPTPEPTQCNLADMTKDSYWTYPAVSASISVSNLFKYGNPMWHSPSCPSFNNRMKRVESKMQNLCMIGDSNTIRTCSVMKEKRKSCEVVGKGTEDAFKTKPLFETQP